LKKREQELIASHEAKLREIESKQRDEYLEALQTQVAADAKKEDALRQTIQELQAALENAQEIATQREEEYQRRIEALQSQIEEMEARAGSASVVSVAATKPLLRQIAELQEQLSSKDQTYQTLEKRCGVLSITLIWFAAHLVVSINLVCVQELLKRSVKPLHCSKREMS